MGIYLEGELLGHRVSISSEVVVTVQFSIVAMLNYIPSAAYEVPVALHPYWHLVLVFICFDVLVILWGIVLSHSGLNLHFPDEQGCWAPVPILTDFFIAPFLPPLPVFFLKSYHFLFKSQSPKHREEAFLKPTKGNFVLFVCVRSLLCPRSAANVTAPTQMGPSRVAAQAYKECSFWILALPCLPILQNHFPLHKTLQRALSC